jgi:hypothetical protein
MPKKHKAVAAAVAVAAVGALFRSSSEQQLQQRQRRSFESSEYMNTSHEHRDCNERTWSSWLLFVLLFALCWLPLSLGEASSNTLQTWI